MLLSGCGVFGQGNSAASGKKPSGVLLTEADNGKSITVHLGEKVLLRLSENPSTGFRWAVESGASGITELRGSHYLPAKDSTVGRGGQRIFVFETKGSGRVRLVLKLRREWGSKSVASRFKVYIEVVDRN
jgi:inhibitor of cysteine peptidase